MRTRSVHAQGGFSLIEVVVALAIVALMLGAVYHVSSGALRSTVRTDNYLRALAVAKSQLAEVSAQPILKVGTVLGSTGGTAWSSSVKPFAAPQPTPGKRLYHVTVVAMQNGSKVSLETVLIAGVPRE